MRPDQKPKIIKFKKGKLMRKGDGSLLTWLYSALAWYRWFSNSYWIFLYSIPLLEASRWPSLYAWGLLMWMQELLLQGTISYHLYPLLFRPSTQKTKNFFVWRQVIVTSKSFSLSTIPANLTLGFVYASYPGPASTVLSCLFPTELFPSQVFHIINFQQEEVYLSDIFCCFPLSEKKNIYPTHK